MPEWVISGKERGSRTQLPRTGLTAMDEKVLLVDDEEDFLEAMTERMRVRGISMKTTTSPSEALRIAREEPLDAVILDLMMPETNGFEVLKELKRIKPGLRVILLTGYATEETRVKAKRLGAVDLVEKPADIRTLTDKIRKGKDGDDRERP